MVACGFHHGFHGSPGLKSLCCVYVVWQIDQTFQSTLINGDRIPYIYIMSYGRWMNPKSIAEYKSILLQNDFALVLLSVWQYQYLYAFFHTNITDQKQLSLDEIEEHWCRIRFPLLYSSLHQCSWTTDLLHQQIFIFTTCSSLSSSDSNFNWFKFRLFCKPLCEVILAYYQAGVVWVAQSIKLWKGTKQIRGCV